MSLSVNPNKAGAVGKALSWRKEDSVREIPTTRESNPQAPQIILHKSSLGRNNQELSCSRNSQESVDSCLLDDDNNGNSPPELEDVSNSLPGGMSSSLPGGNAMYKVKSNTLELPGANVMKTSSNNSVGSPSKSLTVPCLGPASSDASPRSSSSATNLGMGHNASIAKGMGATPSLHSVAALPSARQVMGSASSKSKKSTAGGGLDAIGEKGPSMEHVPSFVRAVKTANSTNVSRKSTKVKSEMGPNSSDPSQPEMGKNLSTLSAAENFVNGLDEMLSTDHCLPEMLMKERRFSFLSYIFPIFMRGLELRYKKHIVTLVTETSLYGRAKHMCGCLILGVVAIFADWIAEAPGRDARSDMIKIMMFICYMVCGLLFVVWGGLMLAPKGRSWRLHGLGWVHIILLTFLLSILILACDGKDPGEQRRELVFSVLALQFVGLTPFPVPLKGLLSVVVLTPLGWFLFSFFSRESLDATVFVPVFCLTVSGWACFTACRNAEVDRRRHFLFRQFEKARRDVTNNKIDNLQDEVQELENFVPSEDFLHALLEAHKTRIGTIKSSMEDSQAKDKIGEEHFHLMKEYAQLARFKVSPNLPDRVENSVAAVNERFNRLKTTAVDESKRLALMMGTIWDEFKEDPHFNLLNRCPSFANPSQEKLHQKHNCGWWTNSPALYSIAEKDVGLATDKMEYFSARALWARQPFIKALKEAVHAFNQASSSSDLIDPEEALRHWNEKHPNATIEQHPFPVDVNFLESIPLAKSLKHECLEHGRNAALQIGPNKLRSRAEAKVEEYRDDPERDKKYPDKQCPERYVLDWLRARVVFSSPASLAVFFWYLACDKTPLRVVLCKNKLIQRPGQDTSVNIHMNVQFAVQGELHVAEVQLVLEPFILAKDLEHSYYEYRRATRPVELLSPIIVWKDITCEDPDNLIDEEEEIVNSQKFESKQVQRRGKGSILDRNNPRSSAKSNYSVKSKAGGGSKNMRAKLLRGASKVFGGLGGGGGGGSSGNKRASQAHGHLDIHGSRQLEPIGQEASASSELMSQGLKGRLHKFAFSWFKKSKKDEPNFTNLNTQGSGGSLSSGNGGNSLKAPAPAGGSHQRGQLGRSSELRQDLFIEKAISDAIPSIPGRESVRDEEQPDSPKHPHGSASGPGSGTGRESVKNELPSGSGTARESVRSELPSGPGSGTGRESVKSELPSGPGSGTGRESVKSELPSGPSAIPSKNLDSHSASSNAPAPCESGNGDLSPRVNDSLPSVEKHGDDPEVDLPDEAPEEEAPEDLTGDAPEANVPMPTTQAPAQSPASLSRVVPEKSGEAEESSAVSQPLDGTANSPDDAGGAKPSDDASCAKLHDTSGDASMQTNLTLATDDALDDTLLA